LRELREETLEASKRTCNAKLGKSLAAKSDFGNLKLPADGCHSKSGDGIRKNQTSGVASFILLFIHFIGSALFDYYQTKAKGESSGSEMGLSREPVKVLFWLAAVGQQPMPARLIHSESAQFQDPNSPRSAHNTRAPATARSLVDTRLFGVRHMWLN
jgi:hypothetical protein